MLDFKGTTLPMPHEFENGVYSESQSSWYYGFEIQKSSTWTWEEKNDVLDYHISFYAHHPNLEEEESVFFID